MSSYRKTFYETLKRTDIIQKIVTNTEKIISLLDPSIELKQNNKQVEFILGFQRNNLLSTHNQVYFLKLKKKSSTQDIYK